MDLLGECTKYASRIATDVLADSPAFRWLVKLVLVVAGALVVQTMAIVYMALSIPKAATAMTTSLSMLPASAAAVI